MAIVVMMIGPKDVTKKDGSHGRVTDLILEDGEYCIMNNFLAVYFRSYFSSCIRNL